MRTPAIALAVTAAAAITLTACGSGSSSNTTTGSMTTGGTTTGDKSAGGACDLLTAADVSSAVGAPVNDGKLEQSQDTPYGRYTVCVWTEKEKALNTVRVSVWEKASAYDASKTDQKDAEEISGIGEKAFEGSFASVFAVVNGHTLFAQYYSLDGSDAENLPKTKAVAQKAAANL